MIKLEKQEKKDFLIGFFGYIIAIQIILAIVRAFYLYGDFFGITFNPVNLLVTTIIFFLLRKKKKYIARGMLAAFFIIVLATIVFGLLMAWAWSDM